MSDLIAEKIENDPRVKKAKKDLLLSVEKHVRSLSKVSPPQKSKKSSYAKMLKQLSDYRSFPPWYPYIGSGAGNGALVELADGSVKYDFISGIGVHFGHMHPAIMEALITASIQNCAMQTPLQQNRDSLQLMQLLCNHSRLPHCFLTTSGAMACENAFKIIFQKKFPASRILAFDRCFMGRTLTLAQITDKPNYREGLPLNVPIDYIPFYDEKDPEGSIETAVETLNKHLRRYPKQHACMAFELIQGEAGYYPGSHRFFTALMEILKKEGIAIFIDEVQTFGRTDHLFAFQHFKLQPYADVVAVGKLLHTCATLFTEDYKPRTGLIAQTFSSTTGAIHTSLAVLNYLIKHSFFGSRGKNNRFRDHFIAHLQRLAKKYPKKISGPFGYGTMIAFTPFKGEQEKAVELAKALFEAGLIAFIGGAHPTRIRFHLPIGSVRLEDIDGAVKILEETLKK